MTAQRVSSGVLIPRKRVALAAAMMFGIALGITVSGDSGSDFDTLAAWSCALLAVVAIAVQSPSFAAVVSLATGALFLSQSRGVGLSTVVVALALWLFVDATRLVADLSRWTQPQVLRAASRELLTIVAAALSVQILVLVALKIVDVTSSTWTWLALMVLVLTWAGAVSVLCRTPPID